jgi:phage/plasmid-associated DNA primase
MEFYNFFLPKVSTPLDRGILPASELHSKIQSHDGSEAYHSMFDMEKRPDYRGYQGIARPAMGWFVLDFDALNLEEAALELLKVWNNLKLTEFFALIFFSGSKGFHLYIREEFFQVPHDLETVKRYQAVTSKIKKDFNLKTLDDGIVQANRKFRAPMSKHPKTGLYKSYLTLGQLNVLSIDQIKENAKTPGECHMDYAPEITERYFIQNPITFKTMLETGLPWLKDGSPENVQVMGILEKQRAGELGAFGHDNVIKEDVQDGTLFKEYKEKICVQRMWAGTYDVGSRHSVALVLISELFNTGIPEGEAFTQLHAWCERQGIDEKRFQADYARALNEQYTGRAPYSFGCYAEIKKAHCSGTCGLYPRLGKERAQVSDVPPKVQKEIDEKDRPTEKQIAEEVISAFQGRIIKQDKDIFIYKDTHWVEASQSEIDAMKEALFVRLGRKAKSKDMKSAFETFLHRVPAVPYKVNMFEPNPNAANFQNGTLWVERVKGEYTLKFKSHSQEDYLTNCLACDYTPSNGAVNSRFTDFLAHLLSGDSEAEEKLRALRQIAGAMVLPRFPQIFFLLGESGSGKSTFLKLFFRLIGGSKVSGFIQPMDMHGFHLEGLIHKTINVHTDVDEHTKIPDSFFKSSGDRVPVQINRKGRKVVQSYLPGVHVFCANTLPPTQVKNQNVYDRRMTIVKLDNVVQERIDQFEDLVFEENTQALVEFALEGLRDVIGSGGFYHKPNSSKMLTKAWQEMGSDSLQDFIEDISHAEVPGVSLDKTGTVKRSTLFDKFTHWATDQGNRETPIKKAKFYRELESRGYRLKKMKDGTRVIEGFAVQGAENEKIAVHAQF